MTRYWPGLILISCSLISQTVLLRNLFAGLPSRMGLSVCLSSFLSLILVSSYHLMNDLWPLLSGYLILRSRLGHQVAHLIFPRFILSSMLYQVKLILSRLMILTILLVSLPQKFSQKHKLQYLPLILLLQQDHHCDL